MRFTRTYDDYCGLNAPSDEELTRRDRETEDAIQRDMDAERNARQDGRSQRAVAKFPALQGTNTTH